MSQSLGVYVTPRWCWVSGRRLSLGRVCLFDCLVAFRIRARKKKKKTYHPWWRSSFVKAGWLEVVELKGSFFLRQFIWSGSEYLSVLPAVDSSHGALSWRVTEEFKHAPRWTATQDESHRKACFRHVKQVRLQKLHSSLSEHLNIFTQHGLWTRHLFTLLHFLHHKRFILKIPQLGCSGLCVTTVKGYLKPESAASAVSCK